ncbi:MAG: sigma-54-dependent Fis family transcriptional regulator [Gemmatimonadetes bacterium]|nr:sigma-54-dependent Fis family transcriptional regulator [Gemmatimonadota bacterium]
MARGGRRRNRREDRHRVAAGCFCGGRLERDAGICGTRAITCHHSRERRQRVSKLTALVVEDDRASREGLAKLVEREDFTVDTCENLAGARAALETRVPDVILTDLELPDGQGTDLLAEETAASSEIVLITGNATVDSVIEALRAGATDYLTKPIDTARLRTLLAGVRRTRELQNEVKSLRTELRNLGRFGPMIGSSPPMQAVYDMIERVAPTDAAVLVFGESGTGKELAAQTVHQLSRRAGAEFVAINCGAIPPTLIESELFGHVKGSFTGANADHKGVFERADKGTLFLDEITEMPLDLQVKLLRVLETGQITRVGGNQATTVDVRVISATNRDLSLAVADEKFRADLYYRLNVFPIALPPLRERGDDLHAIAEHFLNALNAETGAKKKFGGPAIEKLEQHSFPGNVRELKNIVQRAYIMADDMITDAHIPIEGENGTLPAVAALHPPSDVAAGTPAERKPAIKPGATIAEMERSLILSTLDSCDGNRTEAARILGISPKTLYNKLQKYDSSAS